MWAQPPWTHCWEVNVCTLNSDFSGRSTKGMLLMLKGCWLDNWLLTLRSWLNLFFLLFFFADGNGANSQRAVSVLPPDRKHLVDVDIVGALRPPAEWLLHRGTTSSPASRSLRSHSAESVVRNALFSFPPPLFFMKPQVPNLPGIITSLIRFFLFWKFASANQDSPSYKSLRIWGGGKKSYCQLAEWPTWSSSPWSS